MPFPLAHPAAVLPFRRWCPERLDFLALVIGSITPDVGYCFGPMEVDLFSHTLAGSFVFCLPMGWLLLRVCRDIREPLASLLPNPHRDALLLWCRRPTGSHVAVIVSLVLGAWTHIFLDGFTHREGWYARRLALLRVQIPVVGGYEAPLYRILWYAGSVAGLAWLAWSYLQWLKGAGAARLWPVQEKQRCGIWALGLVLPYAAIVPFTIHLLEDRPLVYGIHRFIRASLGAYLVVVSLLLILIGFSLRFRAQRLRHENPAR